MHTEALEGVIRALRGMGSDTARVEAKRAGVDLPKRLWETVSAFSNTPGGGVLLLGVAESEGFEIVGVSNPGKTQSDLAAVCSSMSPPVRAVIEPVEIEGAVVVAAEIPELLPQEKPCFYPPAGLQNGAFIRVGDGNRKLTAYEVQLLLAARGQPKDDREPVPEATLKDLDEDLTAALVRRLRRAKPRFQGLEAEEVLLTTGIVTQGEHGLAPTLAGLLALGAYPQRFFPQLNVTLSVYPSLTPGEVSPDGARLLDSQALDGPIPEMAEQAMSAIQRNMRRRAVIRGVAREDVWEYPETAIREAVVNALVHRDLSAQSRGTPVQIEMFPDRLTVRNPGGLFGPVTIDDLVAGRATSSSRNDLLLRILEDTPSMGGSGPVCENRGSGIPAMLRSLQHAGMSLPQFEDAIATFTVTFPNHTLLDDDTLQWIGRLRQHGLTDTQVFALARMFHGETLTNSTYRSAAGLDSRVAGQELKDLVERGLVQQSGTRGGARYSLPSDLLATTPIGARDRRRSPSDRQRQIVEALSEGPKSRQELQRLMGLQSAGVLRYLRQMKQSGQIEQEGAERSPRTRWRLVRREPTLFGD